ncbi:MAG: ABC transporter ATP-binding protein [Bacteroidetes bacterium]|nr:ABC transporter ATP-binding protein [Bacteroidota bacterium]
MIQINNLTKSYNRFKALDDINLGFDRGRAISLLGPNGSGKTTLIKSILGLVIPEKGTIKIDCNPVSSDCSYRSMIGYMPQIGRYPDNMTIEQVINMVKELRKDCTKYDDELIIGLGIDKIGNKTMRNLSGGTRQKVSACLAFLFSPEILILDEPTAGLDPVSSELLKEKIISELSKGKLVLMTSHVLSDLEGLTSHIVYLQDGKLMFYRSVEELQDVTGETKLNKVVARMMQYDLPIKNCVS